MAYIVKNKLQIPQRKLGMYTIHRNNIVHGVTEIVQNAQTEPAFKNISQEKKIEPDSDSDSDSSSKSSSSDGNCGCEIWSVLLEA